MDDIRVVSSCEADLVEATACIRDIIQRYPAIPNISALETFCQTIDTENGEQQ